MFLHRYARRYRVPIAVWTTFLCIHSSYKFNHTFVLKFVNLHGAQNTAIFVGNFKFGPKSVHSRERSQIQELLINKTEENIYLYDVEVAYYGKKF